MTHLPFLYLRPSPLGGRGVFTAEAVARGTVVELAPVLILSAADRRAIHATRLHDYYFVWDGDGAALALGYGSLYNHGNPANLEYALDYEFEHIRFSAARDLAPGEELLIDYTAGGDRDGLWFTPR